MLVVQRVGQLVGDGRADVGGERRTPHHQLLRLGVVEPDHPRSQQRAHGLDHVELGRDQPQRRVQHLVLAQGVHVLVEVGQQAVLEVALPHQLHVHRLEEGEALRLLHEAADLGDDVLELGLRGRLGRVRLRT